MSKNTVNIWSSRGLSIYGKVTINHAKIYLQFLASADPKEIKKELNQMMKRIFHCNNGALRSFLRFSLEPFGGLFEFLFLCNYDITEIHISSKFYSELLQWWSEFRSVFDSRREFQYVLWSNKEISVDNKPVFYTQKKNFLNKISFS